MSFDLPPEAGPARDQKILEHIKSGDYSLTWSQVDSSYNGHTASFMVFSDGLRIGGVRINVTAANAQQIADLLYCMLPTAKIMDLMWVQRKYTVAPITQSPNLTTTALMLNESNAVDNALRSLHIDPESPDGIIMSTGKVWLIDEWCSTSKATNYGWNFVGPTFGGSRWEANASLAKDQTGQVFHVIQGRGAAHDASHVDYSQILILVSRQCLLDGKPYDLAKILSDPELAGLAYHVPYTTMGYTAPKVALKNLRQPGVPELQPLTTPPCVGPGCPQLIRLDPEPEPVADRKTSAGAVILSAAGLALVLGGFFGGLAAMRRIPKTKPAR